MIPIKTPVEIRKMRESCQIAAKVLEETVAIIAPGVNTWDIDHFAKNIIEENGARSACHLYQIGSKRYPSYTCLSVNEEVVHGIANIRRVLKVGDIITVDVAISYNGYIGDNARTIAVGRVQPEVERLLRITEESLYLAIEKARNNNRVGDISNTVQTFVESCGFNVIRDFVGHGVGRSLHEEPQIPNFGPKGKFDKLRPGMTLAIEPMVAMGKPEVDVLSDGWTAVTRDRLPAAHFEHTVLVSDGAPEILTRYKK
ncbi:MAG: type I methionyl aminopeptidase [Verrucomicrobiota bacterium]|nr:type I methionyl aminopeptidase [Verrucomicrobiota bacterium]